MEPNPYVESRYRKMRIPCPVCGFKMGARHGNRIWIPRPGRGEITYTEINIEHYGDGHYVMRCNRLGCLGKSFFVSIKEFITLNS